MKGLMFGCIRFVAFECLQKDWNGRIRGETAALKTSGPGNPGQ